MKATIPLYKHERFHTFLMNLYFGVSYLLIYLRMAYKYSSLTGFGVLVLLPIGIVLSTVFVAILAKQIVLALSTGNRDKYLKGTIVVLSAHLFSITYILSETCVLTTTFGSTDDNCSSVARYDKLIYPVFTVISVVIFYTVYRSRFGKAKSKGRSAHSAK